MPGNGIGFSGEDGGEGRSRERCRRAIAWSTTTSLSGRPRPSGDRPAPVNHVGLYQPPVSGTLKPQNVGVGTESGGWTARQPRVPVPTSPIWQAAAQRRPACAREPRGFVPTSPFWHAQAQNVGVGTESGGWTPVNHVDLYQPPLSGRPRPSGDRPAPVNHVGLYQPPLSGTPKPQNVGVGTESGGCTVRQPREPVPISPIWAGGATKRPWASSGIKRSSAVGVSPGLYAQNLRLAKVMHTSTRDDLPAAQDRLRAAASPAPH